MNKRNILLLFLFVFVLSGFLSSLLTLRGIRGKEFHDTITSITRVTDTLVVTDTFRITSPFITKVVHHYERVAVIDEGPEEPDDTVIFDEVVYQDSTYKAWVSGFYPKLDSIEVYPKTVYVTDSVTIERNIVQKPKKWHIGPSFGVGMGTKGIEPFVGLTVTYSLFGLR